MIVREWRGRVAASRKEDYAAHFRQRVAEELRGSPGFLGAELVRRSLGDARVEYTVLSRWEDMNAIRGFAGDDPSAAVVEPGAIQALDDNDTRVVHHERIESVTPTG